MSYQTLLEDNTLVTKWADVLDNDKVAPIKDYFRKHTTATLLENTVNAMRTDAEQNSFRILSEASPIPANFMGSSSSTAGTGGIDTFDPVLISLVRRAYPNLMAYDIAGVQPMTGPAGLIFALRAKVANQSGTEIFYNESNTAVSTVRAGNSSFGESHTSGFGIPGQSNTTAMVNTANYNVAGGMTTAQLEALGTDSNTDFEELAFTIDKTSVTAKGRALKAEYTMELAQDLKAIHGLQAEALLSDMLTKQILADINREVVRTVNIVAKIGSQTGTVTPGIYDLDTDSNGRWSVERFKGLLFRIETEANQIAKETRRGKGNILICSSNVASALRLAGVLDYAPALNSNNNLSIDDTGNTFAGVLGGSIKVYIDPYAMGGEYFTIGYKGSDFADAGLFYCPYVPLQMVRAVDPNSFQPKIGYKTRYGMVANPFAQGGTEFSGDGITVNSNVYYRKSLILNLQ
jgi:hypothetical protein